MSLLFFFESHLAGALSLLLLLNDGTRVLFLLIVVMG